MPELPRELPVADVERDHPPRAALEEAVREPSSRGAHVERYQVTHLETEGVEGAGELLAAAAHVGRVGGAEAHLGIGGDLRARPGDRATGHAPATPQDRA